MGQNGLAFYSGPALPPRAEGFPFKVNSTFNVLKQKIDVRLALAVAVADPLVNIYLKRMSSMNFF